MNAYVSAVTVNVSAPDGSAAVITVDSGGNANVAPRFSVHGPTERAEVLDACLSAGLVHWVIVGPLGGEDSVLVATAALMDQLEPTFALDIKGEEE